jgi:hypothetical protein
MELVSYLTVNHIPVVVHSRRMKQSVNVSFVLILKSARESFSPLQL